MEKTGIEEIKIEGARVHNLKNLSLVLPKNKLLVITGVSGSGKSSLAFDIVFEEGKNQYLQSIGILSGFHKENRFDSLTGIGPAVAVKQNIIRQNNSRSTVGSKTAILNQLAFIYAGDGVISGSKKHLKPGEFLYTTTDGMCIRCQGRGTYEDVVDTALPDDSHTSLLQVYQKLRITAGFLNVLRRKYGAYFDTPYVELPDNIREKVVYGTYEGGKQSYCLERMLRNAKERGEEVSDYYHSVLCPVCQGERIREEAGEVLLHGKRFGELGKMTLTELREFLMNIPKEELSEFSRNMVQNLLQKLDCLLKLKLGHLTLYREMSTLSGGEIQRIFLQQHLESGLSSLIYVFDEPLAGLHPSEKKYLSEAVLSLRDLGNTVLVVEHDPEMMQYADAIIEIGPGAGLQGGTIVFQGSYKDYLQADTPLSVYLSGRKNMPGRISKEIVLNREEALTLSHADTHHLKNLTVSLPLHAMVGVAGVSGSGKSSLIEGTLLKRLAGARKYGNAKGLTGFENIGGFVAVSQEPIGRNAGSTPASYIGIWDKIRELFAAQPEAVENRLQAGYFSFHSKGACPACQGTGMEKIVLTSGFSIEKVCSACHGKRFAKESLQVRYREKTIAEILDMEVEEAASFFRDQKGIEQPLQILFQMGMGYLKLGQPVSTLSGGEAQRLKLAKELGKKKKGNILYILDEPTTGLSLYDTDLLLHLLDRLVKEGNSVLVIEHNTDVLRACDYIVELGPEGGDRGGELIAKGTPRELTANKQSKIGRFLK